MGKKVKQFFLMLQRIEKQRQILRSIETLADLGEKLERKREKAAERAFKTIRKYHKALPRLSYKEWKGLKTERKWKVVCVYKICPFCGGRIVHSKTGKEEYEIYCVWCGYLFGSN